MKKNFSRIFSRIALNLLKKTNFKIEELEKELQKHNYNSEKINSRWISEFPPLSNLSLFYGHLPDRYSVNFDKYLKQNPFLNYKDLKKWVYGNYKNNSGDFVRFFFLNQCFETLLKEKIVGNVAELGVYKGNSAFLLGRYAKMLNTQCYLLDTFSGFDSRDLRGADLAADNTLFRDTSIEEVERIVEGNSNIQFIKGYFPESVKELHIEGQFALVHLDCDLERPFKAGLEYFYPKLCRGGFLVMHDYSSLYWPAIGEAVDSFFAGKPEFKIMIPDKSGTCVVRKQ